jgi:FtsZ-interacting cell division protein YlmF
MWYGGEDLGDTPEEDTAQERSAENPSQSQQRRARLLKMPSVREKHIYTMAPSALNEATIAADYLKAGCAVFLNLQNIERLLGQRIVDVMAGVCYGVDGHYHKVGDRLFFFVPRDFHIESDDDEFGSVDGLFVGGFVNHLEDLSNEPQPLPPQTPTTSRQVRW